MNRDYVVLVIPDWFSLALSLFVLWLASTNLWVRRQAGKRVAVLAQKCAQAADAYARSDEALAPVQDALGQPDQAAYTRARVVQHREMAQPLRDRNRRRGWRGLFRASPEPGERLTPPGEGERAPEGLTDALRADR